MKEETRIKIRSAVNKVGRVVRDWGVPVLLFSTVVAAWDGHVTANRNAKEIKRLTNNENVMADVINHNADCLCKTNDRVSELESKNRELLDEALKETEGGEPAA